MNGSQESRFRQQYDPRKTAIKAVGETDPGLRVSDEIPRDLSYLPRVASSPRPCLTMSGRFRLAQDRRGLFSRSADLRLGNGAGASASLAVGNPLSPRHLAIAWRTEISIPTNSSGSRTTPRVLRETLGPSAHGDGFTCGSTVHGATVSVWRMAWPTVARDRRSGLDR